MTKRFDFDTEVAKHFKAALLERIPDLRLGKIDFEVRHDFYMPFRYNGDGKFALNYTPSIAFLEGMTVYTPAQKCRELAKRFHEGTISFMGEVAFHEIGHAVALAMEGQAHRIKQENYGFGGYDVATLPRRDKRIALKKEIEAFAVQSFLYDLCDIPREDTKMAGIMRLINRDEWKGAINKKDKEKIFLDMRRRCTLRSINTALDSLNTHL